MDKAGAPNKKISHPQKRFISVPEPISQIKLNPDLVLTLVRFLLSPAPPTLQTVLLT